jgi:hypothetical protein
VDDEPKTEGEGTMTEASGGGRAEVEGRIVQRSLQDEDFRRGLLEDPRAAVEDELGTPLPEGVAGAGWAEQMTSGTTCVTYCAYRGC